jgi:hypothetical protein
MIVHVGHNGLVHSTIPRYIARSSESVSVDVLVSHVENRVLTNSPLSVCVRDWRVLWQNAGNVPVEKVWIVCKSFGVQGMVVHDNWTIVSETATETSDNKECNPAVSKGDTSVEILNWELANNEKTEEAADLCSGCIVGPVEIRSINRSGNFFHLAAGEPASKDSELALGLRCPCWHDFFEVVFRQTKADQFVILNVF